MKAAFVLSPRARSDLDAIWDHGIQWGEDRTERYMREIQRGIEYVAEDPRRGRPCDDIRAGYFKYPAGSHMLFFRLVRGGIDVVRILHQRMDFERHL